MKPVVKTMMILLVIGAIVCGVALGIVVWQVYRSVQEYTAIAQQAHPHPGDDVAALVAYMESDAHSLGERNHATWALGHLRDPEALPALASVYTGELCDHERGLCQYELEKAIKLCGGVPDPPRKTRH